jgi:hypothetical protein
MTHPLSSLPSRTLTPLFWRLLVLTVLMMVLFNPVGAPLTTTEAPLGIVSFELAGTLERATAILSSWEASAQLRAAFIQGLDYLFIVIYSTMLALGCVWAGRILKKRAWPLASLSAWFAWGQWLAAGFDTVENVALLAVLFGRMASPLPQVAWVCATLKFTLILIGIAYIFYALVAYLATPVPSQERTA